MPSLTDKVKSALYYDSNTCTIITILYVVLTILWIFLVIYLQIWNTFGGLILLFPPITFLIAIWSCSSLSCEVEDEMSKASYLSIGLIIALPLFTWLSKDYSGDKKKFTTIIVIALILSMVTYVDIWLPTSWISAYKHFRSSLQVMSMTLFIYSLVNYYLLKGSFN